MQTLVDNHERKFTYLRLSVTDRCNFRCIYCLPNGYKKPVFQETELSPREIFLLVSAFAELGVTKVRITGGEPTLRRDLLEIIKSISVIPSIRKIAVTTNGSNLPNLAAPLRAAGVSAINVSIDSLVEENFRKATGTQRMMEVLQGLHCAIQENFDDIKINAVLMKGTNENEIENFLSLVRSNEISVRFIELMRTGENADFFNERHISSGTLLNFLINRGWQPVGRNPDDGPAMHLTHKDYIGRIGIIAPYSKDFCKSCNRLRVTSRGNLRLCLFGESEQSLRPFLQNETQRSTLVNHIHALVHNKPTSHYLKEGKYGNTWNLSATGG